MIISFGLLLLVLIFCCYLPAFTIFHDHSRPVSVAQGLMYMTAGMGGIGVFVVCAKAAGIDMRMSVIPGVLLSLYALIRYKRRCLPRIEIQAFDGHPWAAIFLSAIYFLYILIPGILMGRGNYPPVFFSVDSPFYLGQIHALIRNDAWPPISLSALGESFGYHYGSQGICALFSVLTGFTLHASAFLIYMPLTTLGIISVVWLIVKVNGIQQRRLLWPGILILLFFTRFYPISRVIGGLYQTVFYAKPWAIPQSLLSILLNPETFSSYPMLSTQFGLFSTMTVIYCLQNISESSRQRLAAFIIGILMAFKSPDFLTLGMGFGLWILYKIYRTRNVKLLLAPAAALLIGIGLHALSQSTELVALVIAPGQLISDKYRFIDIVGSILIYTLPVWITVKYRASLAKDHILYYWFFIVPPLLITNIFGMVRTYDQAFCNTNLFEIIHLAPLFSGMFVFSVLQINWGRFTRQARSFIVMSIVIIAIFPVTHKILHTFIPLIAHEYAHEYVNNQPLGEALAHIPVEDSILVTNDFRYPADNYKSDLRQMQFPALFGHQAYAVNFEYEYYSDANERLTLQQRFRKPEWDPELETLAQKLGWTHLVIHRDSPHSKAIPLPLIFENETYLVYAFRHYSDEVVTIEE